MPRTKVESTADAVEEQKTDAVEDTRRYRQKSQKLRQNPSTQSRNLQTGQETFSKSKENVLLRH